MKHIVDKFELQKWFKIIMYTAGKPMQRPALLNLKFHLTVSRFHFTCLFCSVVVTVYSPYKCI